jgi:hypothetical protein
MKFSIAIYHSVFIVDYGENGFVAIPQRERWTRIWHNVYARLMTPNKVELKVDR